MTASEYEQLQQDRIALLQDKQEANDDLLQWTLQNNQEERYRAIAELRDIDLELEINDLKIASARRAFNRNRPAPKATDKRDADLARQEAADQRRAKKKADHEALVASHKQAKELARLATKVFSAEVIRSRPDLQHHVRLRFASYFASFTEDGARALRDLLTDYLEGSTPDRLEFELTGVSRVEPDGESE